MHNRNNWVRLLTVLLVFFALSLGAYFALRPTDKQQTENLPETASSSPETSSSSPEAASPSPEASSPEPSPAETQEPLSSYEITARQDLLVLMMAYPGQIAGLETGEDGNVYLIMRSGSKIVYDDRAEKTFEQKLYDADLQDMLAQAYPLGTIDTIPPENNDPGRIRAYAFFYELYGESRDEIESNLTYIVLGGGTFPFNENNGAAAALKAAFTDIDALLAEQPEIYSFVYPVNGTFNYRVIAGTDRLSPHAFALAVDLKSNAYDYWQWATQAQGQSRLDDYPQQLVAVFEQNGFIWGGKWSHFDFLHFEYRPELLFKAQYAVDAATLPDPWYTGFSETEATVAYIGMIEAALG